MRTEIRSVVLSDQPLARGLCGAALVAQHIARGMQRNFNAWVLPDRDGVVPLYSHAGAARTDCGTRQRGGVPNSQAAFAITAGYYCAARTRAPGSRPSAIALVCTAVDTAPGHLTRVTACAASTSPQDAADAVRAALALLHAHTPPSADPRQNQPGGNLPNIFTPTNTGATQRVAASGSALSAARSDALGLMTAGPSGTRISSGDTLWYRACADVFATAPSPLGGPLEISASQQTRWMPPQQSFSAASDESLPWMSTLLTVLCPPSTTGNGVPVRTFRPSPLPSAAADQLAHAAPPALLLGAPGSSLPAPPGSAVGARVRSTACLRREWIPQLEQHNAEMASLGARLAAGAAKAAQRALGGGAQYSKDRVETSAVQAGWRASVATATATEGDCAVLQAFASDAEIDTRVGPSTTPLDILQVVVCMSKAQVEVAVQAVRAHNSNTGLTAVQPTTPNSSTLDYIQDRGTTSSATTARQQVNGGTTSACTAAREVAGSASWG